MNNETVESGTLYVVGTPIGNLGDLSMRAASTLLSVHAVVCEDTRRTGKLLAHIRQSMVGSAAEADDDAVVARPDLLVANVHTEFNRIPDVVERLGRDQAVALVSDAGMPLISDPGAALVAAVVDAGFEVVVVPGPTAVSAAVAISGLPTERYVFEGFLPRKGQDRQRRLKAIATETERMIVLYEAPHRLLKTLRDLAAALEPTRRVSIGRELTKMHEEVVRVSLAEAALRYEAESPRGEFVLVVAAAPKASGPPTDDELRTLLRTCLDDGSSTRDAVAEVVAETGQPKRKVYELATALAATRDAGQ